MHRSTAEKRIRGTADPVGVLFVWYITYGMNEMRAIFGVFMARFAGDLRRFCALWREFMPVCRVPGYKLYSSMRVRTIITRNNGERLEPLGVHGFG